MWPQSLTRQDISTASWFPWYPKSITESGNRVRLNRSRRPFFLKAGCPLEFFRLYTGNFHQEPHKCKSHYNSSHDSVPFTSPSDSLYFYPKATQPNYPSNDTWQTFLGMELVLFLKYYFPNLKTALPVEECQV